MTKIKNQNTAIEKEFIEEIQEYCSKAGISEKTLFRKAANYTNSGKIEEFIQGIGTSIRFRLVGKVRDYMAKNPC